MISRVSTPLRAARLSLQLLHQLPFRFFSLADQRLAAQNPPCDASATLPASNKSREKAGKRVDTCSDGRNEGHYLAQQAPVKPDCSLVQQDACSDGFVKLSAPRTGRKEGHSVVQAAPCSDGSVKVSESKTGKVEVQRSALQASCSYGSLNKLGYGSLPPKTGRQEEVSSLVSQTPCEDASLVLSGQSASNTERKKGQSAVGHTSCTNGSTLASTTERNGAPVPLSPINDPSEVLHPPMEGSKSRASTHNIKRRCKKNTSNDASLELLQKVKLLESEQVSPSDAKTLLTRKAFMSTSPEQLAVVLKVLKEFCESGEKACQVLAENAGVLLQPVELLQQKLKVLDDFQLGKEALLRLGTRRYMLTLKVEVLKRTLTFLKEIGLSVESRNKMICKNPNILRLSVENSMQPTLDFLENVGIARQRVLRLLQTRPELLGMSIDNNLMVKHKFFQQMGFSAKEFSVAIRYLSQYPTEHIFAQVEFMKEQGFSDADVALMVRKQPGILAKSKEDIKNKLHYLLYEQNRDMTEVVKFPTCLGYSLEERIIPRFKILKEKNPLRIYSLSTILALKDSEFRERFKVRGSVNVM